MQKRIDSGVVRLSGRLLSVSLSLPLLLSITACSGAEHDTLEDGDAGRGSLDGSSASEGDGDAHPHGDGGGDPDGGHGDGDAAGDGDVGTGDGDSGPGDCAVGYADDGSGTCQDVDECQQGRASCDLHASCVNTPGSYTCACADGWVGDGQAPFGCASRIEAGYSHVCVIPLDGSVKCWGDGTAGRLGYGDTSSYGAATGQTVTAQAPLALPAGRKALGLALGYKYSCVLLDDGSVRCWGANDYGQLGQGDNTMRGDTASSTPDKIPAVELGAGRKAVAIRAGYEFTCAVLDDHSVKCWGENGRGQLGQGDTTARGDDAGELGDALKAVDLGTGRHVRALDLAYKTACAVLDTGKVKCWGDNSSGQLGIGDTSKNFGDNADEMGDMLPTVDLGSNDEISEVSAGGLSFCTRSETDAVKCWGLNSSFAVLGNGTANDIGDDPDEMGSNLAPVKLGTGITPWALATSATNTCVISRNPAAVKCWGDNQYGELALGTTGGLIGDSAAEMGDNLPLYDLGGVPVAMGVGSSFICSLLADGKLKCTGANYSGALGIGSNVSSYSDNDVPAAAELW